MCSRTSYRYLKILAFALALLNIICVGEVGAAQVVKSPDENVVVTFDIKDVAGESGCMVYSAAYKGREIVVDSRLGLAIKDAPALESGFYVAAVSGSSNDTTYSPVYGERNAIRDNYNELVVKLRESQQPHRRLELIFRAYNEGAAFRYTLPRQEPLKSFIISAERTQFRFTADHRAWAVYSAQGRYSKTTLGEIKNNCERPLTIEIDGGPFAAVAEAGLVDYARMRLSGDKRQAYTLVSSLAGEVEATTPYRTPWRVLLLGDTPGQLLERNYLILNLNEPCAIKDTSWIKPGKVIREVTLTTTGGKACVDFAAEHNLQYVEFDAGWYGPEGSEQSDARTISLDPKRSKGPLDLHAVINYAKKRDIGIILYVNRRALERQLDEILPLYEKWGIKGVKYGFVQVGSQKWTKWLHEAVRKAAKYHLMVDIHDEYRPTGYSRTYPNLMTQEGIGGDETSPSNTQTLTILFTRMLAGAGDNTICYYDGRVDRNASHAYQLAKAVCIYSPWQFLYWYDRPQTSPPRAGGAGGSRGGIGDEPELEFFDHVPTVWDDTKVIHGKIGEYAVIARRSGENWFIGCMNSNEPRTLEIPLTFLDKSRKYTAHIYSDDPKIQTRTHVRIDRYDVNSETILKAEMTAKGGQAIRITVARASADERKGPMVLNADSLKRYVDTFNKNDEQLYIQHIPNEKAWGFLKQNIPLFECPDKDFERTYYFRWWTYRKHVKHTPDGFVITEFLPKVGWSGKHNTINCPAGHHFYEGRWIHDPKFLDDYAVFWFRKGGSPRRYSFWAADALRARNLVRPNKKLITDLLADLVKNYEEWEKSRLEPDGLFWQIDDRDGMEVSVGGSGKRATINSYMYGDAVAITKIAELAGKKDIAERFAGKAKKLKELVMEKLWDDEAKFFKTLPRDKQTLVDVREQHGYTPWYFNLPDAGRGYEVAWKQLMDPNGFYAPFGPTTAEQRHPRFTISYKGHECQWNGPSWPLSTSITLTALANVLNNYQQDAITKADYFETLKIYTKSHRLKREDGQVVPWIDENLNPFTGDWLSRTRLKAWKNNTWDAGKGGKERGKDYNHSSYCDLIITGLAGLRPRPDEIIEVNPLVRRETWDWFCLDNVLYHGKIITILWDKTGKKYGRGKGLRVYADGKEIAQADSLRQVTGKLPSVDAAINAPSPKQKPVSRGETSGG